MSSSCLPYGDARRFRWSESYRSSLPNPELPEVPVDLADLEVLGVDGVNAFAVRNSVASVSNNVVHSTVGYETCDLLCTCGKLVMMAACET